MDLMPMPIGQIGVEQQFEPQSAAQRVLRLPDMLPAPNPAAAHDALALQRDDFIGGQIGDAVLQQAGEGEPMQVPNRGSPRPRRGGRGVQCRQGGVEDHMRSVQHLQPQPVLRVHR